ncbi:hypothetical protein ACU3L3_07510 [Priestia endophytica]
MSEAFEFQPQLHKKESLGYTEEQKDDVAKAYAEMGYINLEQSEAAFTAEDQANDTISKLW